MSGAFEGTLIDFTEDEEGLGSDWIKLDTGAVSGFRGLDIEELE